MKAPRTNNAAEQSRDIEQERRLQQRLVSCAWSKREWEGSCNVCQTRDDPKVLCVTLPHVGFRVCKSCAAVLISELERAANKKLCNDDEQSE